MTTKFYLRSFVLAFATVASVIYVYSLNYSKFHDKRPKALQKSEPSNPNKDWSDLIETSLSDEASETNISKRFEVRNHRWQKKCSQEPLNSGVMLVTGHTPAKVSLCVVPKAACTQWLGLFKFLANQNSSNNTLSSYSKYAIHDGPGKPYVRYTYNGKDRDLIQNSVRVITARDPYRRLWSAYVDKLWLPSFWKSKGIQVINMVRHKATPVAKSCGHDVTFTEFLQYVINIGHKMTFWGFDYHWLPVIDICNPCKFSPHFIMKQETFVTDYKFILNRVGLLHFVEPTFQSANQDETEIRNEIDYAYRMFQKYKLEACISKIELTKRIWKAMIYNGYLQPEDEFPQEVSEDNLETSVVVKLILETRRNHTSDSSTKKANRAKILSDMYSQISSDQLKALKQLFRLDFEMFGYNSTPPIQ